MGIEHVGGQTIYKCRNGHKLEMNYVSIGYPGGKYSCDNCKKTRPCTEGRYNCQYCQWDLCRDCSNAYKPKPNPVLNCKAKHALHYTVNQYHGNYACDSCKRTYPSSQQRWCCTMCKYDICAFCRPPPMPSPMPHPMPGPIGYQPGPMPGPIGFQPMPGPIPGTKTHCHSGHYLTLTNYYYPGGQFTCRMCGAPVPCSAGQRYACTTCKYDVCQGCYAS